MAMFDASHGSADGLEAFHAFSEKNANYNADTTDDRWSHWHRSPPSNLSGGTLREEMRKIDPLWVPTWPAEEIDVTLFASRDEDGDGPVDLFGDCDPGELGDLPLNALPEMLTRMVRSEARRKGVSEAFTAASVVTAFGAAIGGDGCIQVRQRDDDWTESANLWTVLVAPPGRPGMSEHRSTRARDSAGSVTKPKRRPPDGARRAGGDIS